MSRPSNVLREAAHVASSSTARAPRFSLNPLGPKSKRYAPGTEPAKAGRDKRVHHMIIQEVPKSASPRDVLRALQQNGAVDQDFPISAITMPPPSLPRGLSLMKNVHVTLQDVTFDQAHHAINALIRRPLFPETSTWAQFPRPASNLGMRADIPAYPTANDGKQWVQDLLKSLPGGRPREAKESAYAWKVDTKREDGEIPSAEWSMDGRTRGRRVLLRGLPGLLPAWRIRRVTGEYGVAPEQRGQKETDDVKRLPASFGGFTSTWVVTTDSVNNACRLVRKLNRQYWNKEINGEKYLVRAEVIW